MRFGEKMIVIDDGDSSTRPAEPRRTGHTPGAESRPTEREKTAP